MPPFPGTLSERAFTGGELTPSAWARVDIENYLRGLRTARNGLSSAGVGSSTGLAQCHGGSDRKWLKSCIRLIPFVFSNNVAYVLEFGNLLACASIEGWRAGGSGNAHGLELRDRLRCGEFGIKRGRELPIACRPTLTTSRPTRTGIHAIGDLSGPTPVCER